MTRRVKTLWARFRAWLARLHVAFPISRGAAYSIVFLFFLSVGIGTANLLWTAHVVNAFEADQARQSQVVEHKLCTTLRHLAMLQPPPGDPKANPSRAYEQRLHATLDQLGPDIRCPS